MDANTDVIRLEGVSVVVDGCYLLRDVSWRVRRGEHWAVLGRNGAGKTTLLNVINGYLWPCAGSGPVEVLGERYGRCDVEQVRRAIGWVSSALHAQLHQRQTVLQVVIGGRYAAMAWWRPILEADRRAAEHWLAEFGCAGLAGRFYHALSQGEQQRVLLARAMMAQPRLLLLDEPCAGLDFVAREAFLGALERLLAAPDGPTVVYVTHHAEEILPGIGAVLVLDGGRVVAHGPKREILSDARLSEALGVPLAVSWERGRPRIHLREPVTARQPPVRG